MDHCKDRFLGSIIAIFIFAYSGFGQQTPVQVISANDEQVIADLVNSFFAAYTKKDQPAINSLFSPKSPYFENAREETAKIFKSNIDQQANVLSLKAFTSGEGHASAEADVEFETLIDKRGRPMPVYCSGRWTFEFVEENGEWKIFRRISAERHFAVKMLTAESEEERNRLLESFPQYSTFLVVTGLIDESAETRPRVTFAEHERICLIAAGIAEKNGNVAAISVSLSQLARRYKEIGNYLKAIELESRALDLERVGGDENAIADRLSSIGLIYLVKGSPLEALPFLRESESLFARIGLPGANWINLYRIGHAYLAMGDFANAMFFYQKSMEVLKKANPNDELAVQHVTIANLYELQGNHEQALENYHQALATFEKTGSSYGTSICLAGLAEVYQNLQYFDKAAEFEEKALAIRKADANFTQTIFSLKRLGIDYAALGQRNRAENYFQEALELAKSRQTDNFLPEIYLEIAKFQMGNSDTDVGLESALLAKRHADAVPDMVENWEIYDVLGKGYLAKEQIPKAASNFEKAIAVIENRTAQLAGESNAIERFFSGMVGTYDRLIELRISQDALDSAFLLSERRRSRALLDTLKNRNLETKSTSGPDEIMADKKLRNELVSINSQIAKETQNEFSNSARVLDLREGLAKKRIEYEAFRTQLYVAHPELKIQRGEMNPISLDETATMLPDATGAILEFVVAEEKTFLFVITKDADGKATLKAYQVKVAQKDLAAKTEAFRSKLEEGSLDFRNTGNELYRLLLKPAETQLSGKTNMIIVPDGPLWNLPFQALQNGQNQYLVEQVAVSYAPSLTALREMSKKAKRIGPNTDLELLAFGNPVVGKETAERVQRVFMSEKLGPIPEAERLVNSLGKMYGPTKSKIYTGSSAREETAKSESPRYRIVQFATHGILNNVSPMYSHLVLAQDEKNPNEDGLLEAWEMKDLDLKADMVILSACDTARGKISNGEGVIGMSWAMFIAGTPTTVASQWKIESSSTTELMLEFHRQLLTGKVSKAEALRRASLKIMKMPKYRHPSYWAGFVLVGDGSKSSLQNG